MPRLSIVVPIYNVEEFLGPCLDSIAAQTFEDFEVILVNDGSPDGSAAIAEAYAARDPRFKVVDRPNGGLSAARNTGIEHATGELLAFVDSDDLLLPDAYKLLVGALDQSGSDFATGNVLRLTERRTRPTWFLREAFSQTRLGTHVKKFRPLLADRVAWNKVFRRSFWDAQGLRFPEGRINEDIPVILPLHFSARAVDVISDPIYLWRFRSTGELSITERRVEQRALLHRIQAVADVHDFLEARGDRKAKRWYDASLVADDLKLYLNVLDRADDAYRELFLDQVNALLDRADDGIYDKLPALLRLKWHLVRRRLMPEVLEVLRFEREDLAEAKPIRRGRHWYGDYPFRGDARLAIPDRIYRLGPELTFTARIESVRRDGQRLHISGLAFVDGLGAPDEAFSKVRLSALAPGPLRRVRLLTTALRFKTTQVHRPDANADGSERRADISWSGFEATLDVRRLRRLGRWRDGTWNVYVTARAPGVTRRRVRFFYGDVQRPRAAELEAPDGVLARVVPTPERELRLETRTAWAAVTGGRVTPDGVELIGEVHGASGAELKLELRGEGVTRLRRPMTVEDGRFTATVPFGRLRAAVGKRRGPEDEDVPDEDEVESEPIQADDDGDAAAAAGDEAETDPVWELSVIGAGRLRVVLPEATAEQAWPCDGREVALFRTAQGEASLALRAPRGTITDARWTADGALEVAGEAPVSRAPQRLVLASRRTGAQHGVDLPEAARGGPFRARLEPGAVVTLAGALPLSEGRWQLSLAGDDTPEPLALTVAPALRDRLPLSAEAGGKTMHLTLTGDQRPVLVVRTALSADERGPYNQRRLQAAYRARRSAPLRDAVVYSSFHGRQFSDSPRAIHEELVRRDAPVEHLWIVRDAAAVVPPTAQVVRDYSEQAYEALATSRYVVYNDHFPGWFERREDQVCVQTWHGTPFKRLGFDVPQARGNRRNFERRWHPGSAHDRNWQYVVSPNRFATPILRRAYRLSGELLETGYPRDDVLAEPDRDARAREVRERLGIPEGVRTLLYAPTFRDHVRDRRGRYRLDAQLDIDRLRAAAGPDTVLLFRKHHYIVDAVPTDPDGFVRDVSTYPDGNELLLAADVLITDYSSLMVDFANTGRPMLFFSYDLQTYQDLVRGFYIDYEATIPGPLVRTNEELADAIADLDAVRARYADRYDAFVARFCELDDGQAAARVVDRVFSDVVAPVTL